MNRLKQLIQDNTFGTIVESDYPELIELLIKERSILINNAKKDKANELTKHTENV